MNTGKLLLYSLLYTATLGIAISTVVLSPRPVESPIFSIFRMIVVCFATVLLGKYTLYMFLCPWYVLRSSREQKLITHFVPNYRPLVSIMIPAWNEEVGLLGTIKSLLASTYTPLELIVVNDGSTDGSDALCREFLAKYAWYMQGIPENERIHIIYHYQRNGGKGAALNTAIGLAHGDILVSIDADCIVSKQAIEAFVQAFRDPRVTAAVGNVHIGNTKTIIGTIQYLEYLFGFYFKKADSLLNTIYIIGGAAGAFRREVFTYLGGYSTHNITEDIELSVRIQKAGGRIVYCSDAQVYTEGATTLRGLMKQRLRWKRGRFQTFIEHRRLFFSLSKQHNKLLTCFILPLALFGDIQLGFEPFFLTILYVFSFVSGDFSAFLSGVLIVSLMFIIQAYDSREEQSWAYMLLAPIGWCLFYVTTCVEVYALVKSLWLTVRGKELKWQKWQRQGAIEGRSK